MIFDNINCSFTVIQDQQQATSHLGRIRNQLSSQFQTNNIDRSQILYEANFKHEPGLQMIYA